MRPLTLDTARPSTAAEGGDVGPEAPHPTPSSTRITQAALRRRGVRFLGGVCGPEKWHPPNRNPTGPGVEWRGGDTSSALDPGVDVAIFEPVVTLALASG